MLEYVQCTRVLTLTSLYQNTGWTLLKVLLRTQLTPVGCVFEAVHSDLLLLESIRQ